MDTLQARARRPARKRTACREYLSYFVDKRPPCLFLAFRASRPTVRRSSLPLSRALLSSEAERRRYGATRGEIVSSIYIEISVETGTRGFIARRYAVVMVVGPRVVVFRTRGRSSAGQIRVPSIARDYARERAPSARGSISIQFNSVGASRFGRRHVSRRGGNRL